MKEKKSNEYVDRSCEENQQMNINRQDEDHSPTKDNLDDGSPPLLSSPPKKSSSYRNHEINFMPLQKPGFGANSSNGVEFTHHLDEGDAIHRNEQINRQLTRSNDLQLPETSTHVNITNASKTALDKEESNDDKVIFSHGANPMSISQSRKRKTQNFNHEPQVFSKKQINNEKRRVNVSITNTYSNQALTSNSHKDSNWNKNIDKNGTTSNTELFLKKNQKKELGVKRPRSLAVNTSNEGKRNFFDLLSPTPTRRGGINKKNDYDPQNNEKSPSLFGAVMNRAFTYSPFSSKSKSKFQQKNSSSITSFESPVKSKTSKLHSKNDVTSSTADSHNVLYNSHISTPSKNFTPTKKTSSFQSPPHSKSNSHSNSNSNLTLNSPGGYTLLKVLDSINNTTPSRYQSPFRNNNDANNNSNSQISSIGSSNNDQHIDDWYEADLGFLQPSNHCVDTCNTPVQGYIMDWNIKNKFKIDCFPGRCLQTLPFLNIQQSILNHNIYESQFNPTMQPSTPHCSNKASSRKFHNNNKDVNKEASSYLDALWKSALLYWQHPAAKYDPDFIKMWNKISFSENNVKQDVISMSSLTKKKDYISKNKDNLSSSKQIHESKKKHSNNSTSQHPVLLALGSLQNKENNQKNSIDNRWKEWQAAFRSMYFSWWNRINSMKTSFAVARTNKDKNTDHTNVEENHNFPNFYVLNRVRTAETSPSCHQIFLFRLSYVESEEVQPVILLSNISPSLANQLKHMGVILHHYIKPKATKSIVSKNTFSSGTSNLSSSQKSKSQREKLFSGGNNTSNAIEDVDDFQKELEALRFASTHEETAGGEIFVQLQRGASAKHVGPDVDMKDLEKPIMIHGWADCHAFYEALLNSRPNFSCGEDVPLLLSRSLGPTLHSTLSSLVVKKCSKLDVSNAANNNLQKETNGHELASFEVKGTILPCAARQLIHATALNLLLDKHVKMNDNTRNLNFNLEELFEKEDETNLSSNSDMTDDDVVGSHYFVAHVEAFDSGRNLNGVQPPGYEDREEKSHKIQSVQECKRGEITSMLVWNVSRPNVIMYKTEKMR